MNSALSQTPALAFTLVSPISSLGIPTEVNDDYTILLDNAVSGGAGTSEYLGRMLEFATLASYLAKAGDDAFTTSDGPAGSMQAYASNAGTSMTIGVALNDNLAETDFGGVPVRGVASVRMATSHPFDVVKYTELGISLAEIPAGLAVGDALMAALFRPLLDRLSSFVQDTISSWLEADVGELDGIADALADTAADVAGEIAEETTEIVVEETVVAEVSLDLAAIAPPLAALGLLIAVPLLIEMLAKDFQVHFEINNLTDHDVEWAVEYSYDGAMTAQPASPTIPKMGRAIDAWGDTTDVDVAYQADFSLTNASGFEGTGFVLRLSVPDLADEGDIAVVLSVPWASDNSIWLGAAGPGTDWQQLWNDHGGGGGPLAVNHGTRQLYVDMGLDAVSGHGDSYHCALRIRSVPPTEQGAAHA
ncbi:hypothetical protein [Antribacter gilvus]|uniref:hypothetical protein n=1 Tax=Antribacter gilvus TaxID=2304675 RepID=UPI000F7A4B4D|nr:hypothetical protein [Antribacter gilvus]